MHHGLWYHAEWGTHARRIRAHYRGHDGSRGEVRTVRASDLRHTREVGVSGLKINKKRMVSGCDWVVSGKKRGSNEYGIATQHNSKNQVHRVLLFVFELPEASSEKSMDMFFRLCYKSGLTGNPIFHLVVSGGSRLAMVLGKKFSDQ